MLDRWKVVNPDIGPNNSEFETTLDELIRNAPRTYIREDPPLIAAPPHITRLTDWINYPNTTDSVSMGDRFAALRNRNITPHIISAKTMLEVMLRYPFKGCGAQALLKPELNSPNHWFDDLFNYMARFFSKNGENKKLYEQLIGFNRLFQRGINGNLWEFGVVVALPDNNENQVLSIELP